MGTICIAIPDSVWSARSEQFYTQVLHGLEATAVPRGHGVLSRVARDLEEELEALRHWAEQGLETVVVLKDLLEDDARPRTAEELGLPYVVIGDERQRPGSSRVTVDNGGMMRLLLQDLRERGHEAIGHVGGPLELLHSRWRREAYEEVMREQGLPTLVTQGDYSAASGAAATQELLDAPTRPSVIVFDNDAMAIAGCERALAAGLRVPQELSIVAWDDSPACQTHEPAIAAIDRQPHQLGVDLALVATALLANPSETLQIAQPALRVIPRATLARSPGAAPR